MSCPDAESCNDTACRQGTTLRPNSHAGLPSHQTLLPEPLILAFASASNTATNTTANTVSSQSPQSLIQSHTRPALSIRSTTKSLRFIPFVLLVLLSILADSTTAALSRVHADRHSRAISAQFGHLLVDRSTGSAPQAFHLALRKETDEDAEDKPSEPSATPTPTENSTPSATSNAPDSSLTAIPMPFDTSLGNNFTAQSCPDFFVAFLNNATFQSCTPLSLLLYNSVSFFDATKTNLRVTQTLDATCNVDYEQCSSLMDHLAQEIPKDTACGADLELGNPSVTQALSGLIAYQPLYAAGCMKDKEGNYCFANAITNDSADAADDSYIYYLPLGTNMPGGSRPTCNSCLTDTMAVFDVAAANETQPLSKTYVAAAGQINLGCGPSFVNATIAQLSGAQPIVGGSAPLLALAVTLLALFI
ncbi:hypothetical protein EJ05DRAFT_501859 [Pseudovirgaria hyperparasitica]|uniref:DUF7729 domain-containing protein n=1 Tax=Pseudovirgaria hyperparasitica TaxID=470096 RepID=A0A6A6W2W1_9PEZI|nr:uncharacterized protein EJ05DRAFT_501859 [Pseudovirgaria hyperparasitica]KAF2756354.1 hypothetical protein EJ05DRAFT_501859 [Pseudovirgaria hyperparasitica]